MKVKELIDLLQKFPPDYDVLYDTRNQLLNDGCYIETTNNDHVLGEEDGWNTEFDGQIEDFYIDRTADGEDLLCLTAKPNEQKEGETH